MIIFVEVDLNCPRLLKLKYPDMKLLFDIRDLKEKVLSQALLDCPKAQARNIVGGGSLNLGFHLLSDAKAETADLQSQAVS